jgi:hypothetical protein
MTMTFFAPTIKRLHASVIKQALRTVMESVTIGIAAALTGVGISLLVNHGFTG